VLGLSEAQPQGRGTGGCGTAHLIHATAGVTAGTIKQNVRRKLKYKVCHHKANVVISTDEYYLRQDDVIHVQAITYNL
jgi:hypothetical protein